MGRHILFAERENRTMIKKLPVIILRITTILFGVAGLVLCVFVLPTFCSFWVELYPAQSFWQYPVYVGMYAAALCYFYALVQFWMALNGINRNGVLPVKNLRAIRRSAIAFSVLYAFFAMPVIYLAADIDDAPGLILIGAFLDTIPIGAAALTAVIERLAT